MKMSTDEKVLKGWKGARAPNHRVLEGRFVRLEPLSIAQHGTHLWQEFAGPGMDPNLYDYMFIGPFEHRANFDDFLATRETSSDPLVYSVIDLVSGKAQGMICFMQIDQSNGVVGFGLSFGASMQRTAKATETVFLMAQEAFLLGFRRLEWMTSNENLRSKRAALRFGFTFECVRRQAFVVKNGNWDIAIYSILDKEWPDIQKAFVRWLSPENFDSNGQQIKSLKIMQLECE